jgi:hypothetical protein
MKKFIYSIAALAAIVVMGSCSQDSDLTSVKSSSSKVDSVTVGLNISSNIAVAETNSSMVKSTTNTTNTSLTRASVTTRGTTTTTETDTHTATAGSSYKDVLKYPTTYTAYFVAKGAQGDYRDGEIVRTASITLSGTTGTTVNVKVPAIKYNIIVTDYNPDSNIYKVGGTIKDSNVNDTYEFSNKLPLSSTDMHMYGSTQKTTKDASGNSISNNGDFSATTSESSETGTTATQKTATAYVTLNSPYALVCVAANDFVSGVVYNATILQHIPTVRIKKRHHL